MSNTIADKLNSFKNKLKLSKKQIIFFSAAIIIIFIIIAFSIPKLNVNLEQKSLLLSDGSLYGYNRSDNKIVSTTNDSRAEFDSNLFLQTLQINLDKPVTQDSEITIYYNTGAGYSEDLKKVVSVSNGADQVQTLLINRNFTNLRIDFGNKVGEEFSVKSITLNSHKNIYFNYYILKLIFILFVLISLLIIAYFIFLFIKKRLLIEKLGITLILTFGTVYMIIMTPFSIPDESYHYASAYKLSNVMLFKFNDLNSGDSEHFNYTGFKGHYNVRSAYDRIAQDIFSPDIKGEKISLSNIRHDDLSFPLLYVPQAIGISVGRILNLNMIWIFFLGRFANLLFFAIMAYFAIKTIPRFKISVLIISIFPMTLHQVSSFSYDGYVNALSLLLVSCIVQSIFNKANFTRKELVKLAIVGALLAPAKIVYTFLLLLLFMIPKSRFKNTKKYLINIGIILVIACLGIIATKLFGILINSPIFVSGMSWDGRKVYSIRYILTQPLSTIYVFLNTIRDTGFFCFNSEFGICLAGYTLPINGFCIFLLQLVFFASALRIDSDELYFGIKQKIFALISFVSVLFLVLLYMFLSWTDYNSNVIQGVQGRYFIPTLLPLCLLINNKTLVLKKNIDGLLISFCVILQLFVYYDIFRYTFKL